MLTRRSFLGAGVASTSLLLFGAPRPAAASLSLGLTLTELVHYSRHTLVGTPVDAFSRWEKVGKRERIVTYSVVRVDAPLDGRAPATREVMVRTLGGVVDDIGQVVAGEAPLARGKPAAVFLEDLSQDLFGVTGMAQGYYPVTTDPRGVRRLRAPDFKDVVVSAASAVRRLDGMTLGDLERLISVELGRAAR